MNKLHVSARSAFRRTPLAASLAALHLLAAPAAFATTLVTNCNDKDAGSLRAAIASAPSGDTVDASGLNGVCSTITLRTGDITVAQTDLTIRGPGSDKLTITGKYGSGATSSTEHYRIFTHNGTGTLTVQQIELSKGYLINNYGNVRGGCIYSKGSVILSGTVVTSCTAKTKTGAARGGGVYARNIVLMTKSTIKYNTANGGTSGASVGGGVYALGNFGAVSSTISGNIAQGDSGRIVGFAGGVNTRGVQTIISASTIANNTAYSNIGGVSIRNTSGSATLTNSTVSGNKAPDGKIGGIYSNIPALYINNSTIALNSAASAGTVTGGTGVAIYAYGSAPLVKLESTLIASNTYGAASAGSDLTITGTAVTGNNNLIRTSAATLPADTITGACPLLAPLHANGGLTSTHALLSHSPAIDTGNDLANVSFDQRGSPFARVSGPPGTAMPAADIGAYEIDRGDEIFNANFEDCL